MNSKKTNRLVTILNIIAVASIYILAFLTEYLLSSIMLGNNEGKSIFNSFIIDTLLNNIQIIMALVYSGVGILNIICAIQNKENKKLFFWQLVFGIYEIWSGINIILVLEEYDFIESVNKIIFGIVPIILALINLIFIKKNKPKIIQIISYIAVIICSILNILGSINEYWNIIAIVMQLIYIHFQDKNTIESKARKIVNVIMYYVLQMIIVIGFLGMILISLWITKGNEMIWEKELSNLYNNIELLQGAKIKEIYIPVENGYKYGFINSNGQEKIQCQYDRVSYFNELEINNNLYYVALAKKDNIFYIISKNNDNIMLKGNLEKYLQTIDEYWSKEMTKMLNEQGNYRNGYIQSFEFFFQVITKGEMKLTQQTIEKENSTNSITLSERNSKYYYDSKNYSIIIEPIYNENENIYHVSSSNTKHRVTITKFNGEQETSIVYLTDFDEDEATLDTCTNGYIRFEDEENKRNGWYDDSGNKITISNTYTIIDIKDNKVMLQIDNTEGDNLNEKQEFHFIIIDMTGRILIQTSALEVYDDIYLVKKDNDKMFLMDKDLTIISKEYDRIIPTIQIDMSPQYSAYY